MEINIKHIAEQLKAGLQNQPNENRKFFLEFANTYAITKKLQHSALILSLNYNTEIEEQKKKALRNEMIALVDEIVIDHQSNINSPAYLEAKAAREQLEAHYLKQELPNQVVFSCEKITRRFPKSNFKLGEVDLNLRLGEITGLVGENGNGKTTLFRIVVGELKHDTGSLSFPYLEAEQNGRIDWIKAKQHIAYVPQELPKWYGSLSNNIKYEAALRGIKGKENEEEVNFIIQRLGLEEHLGKTWGELSGGFKLRFALARALVWKPKLLVIDEPLANLDIKTQLIILKDLVDLSRSFRYPMSIIISSQHLHEIESVSDKILFLKDGQVIYYGDTE